MAKEYKVGDKYYLPVTISSIAPGYQYPIELLFADCYGRDTTDTVRIDDEPELLLTAEDIAMVINTERDDALAELKSRNAELEALLKEVMATRDEAIQQNNELIAENKKLKTENDEWQKTARCYSENAYGNLELTRKLRAEISKLKAERDDLKSKVGKYTADIQDMAAEIHFLKEKGGKQKPEEEATRTVHVVLNDDTGYNFFKCTKASFDNYGNFTVLKIYRGEEYVAGFLRGDKPGNLAYWWTE